MLNFLIADSRQSIDGVDLYILFYQGVVLCCDFYGLMAHQLRGNFQWHPRSAQLGAECRPVGVRTLLWDTDAFIVSVQRPANVSVIQKRSDFRGKNEFRFVIFLLRFCCELFFI